MFLIYNGILRGFGTCGEVKEQIEFGSDEFWKQFKSLEVKKRMEEAGHKFTATIHVLASAIKKLQRTSRAQGFVHGTKVYRGLSGLDVAEFLAGVGFSEKAFMSTTTSREVAIEYSGVKQGNIATILAMEVSEVDQVAVIEDFSQYPYEKEGVWNSCSYLEHRKGKTELLMTKWGAVKLLHVKTSANSKAMTLEELEERRQKIVVRMYETIHRDICRELEDSVETDEFKKRVARDRWTDTGFRPGLKEGFLASIRQGSQAMVEKCKERSSAWFNSNEQFRNAISSGLELAVLARSKRQKWLEDESLDLEDASMDAFLPLRDAHMQLVAWRWQRMETARKDGSDASLLRERVLEYCVAKGWVRDRNSLEAADAETGRTPFIIKCLEGDVVAAQLLLDAGANPGANASEALVITAQMNRADIMKMFIHYFHVNVNAQPRCCHTWTPANRAAFHGQAESLKLLIQSKADLELQTRQDMAPRNDTCGTPLHAAAINGHQKVLELLIAAEADIEAEDAEVSLKRERLKARITVLPCYLDANMRMSSYTHTCMRPRQCACKSCLLAFFNSIVQGQTPAHRAAQFGHSDALKVLINAKANLEATDYEVSWERQREMTSESPDVHIHTSYRHAHTYATACIHA